MARPAKFTEEKAKAICDGLRLGCTRKAAYGSLGIPERTFFDWVARYPQFSQDLTRAEDEAEKRFASVMTQAAAPHDVIETTTVQNPDGSVKTTTIARREFDWRAAESWLKRRRRVEWGDSIDVRKLDDDTLLRLLGLAAGGAEERAPITAAEYVREG